MLEAQVHSELRTFLRTSSSSDWTHHLTMARMVARGLRLGRSTIIQTGVNYQTHCLSYLTSALLSPHDVIIVVNQKIQEQLLNNYIPFLQESLEIDKHISTSLDENNLSGTHLILISPQDWLENIINNNSLKTIPTIVEEAQQLPQFITDYLTIEISNHELLNLPIDNQKQKKNFQKNLVKLTKSIFSHPSNPYDSYLLDSQEQKIILDLVDNISQNNPNAPEKLSQFQQKLIRNEDNINYVVVKRKQGTFLLKSIPLELKTRVTHLWHKNNPLILIAKYLAPEREVTDYANLLGIPTKDYTCLKFSPHAPNEVLKLYFPEKCPFPNEPQFQSSITREIVALISSTKINHEPIIIIIEDVPLQAQITASLASQFGSRVKLNECSLTDNTILVCDIKFWSKNQDNFPPPQLLIMATLPIPSLENPLIASQVNYYKKQKKDWFRLYLLPQAIKSLQQLTVSLRKNQGVLALLDNRVNYRSYGNKVLQALEPYAKIGYLDLTWLD